MKPIESKDKFLEPHQHEAKNWQEENSEALEALNRFHDEYGCFSDEYRTF